MNRLKPQKLRLLCYLTWIFLIILFYDVFLLFFFTTDLYFLILALIAEIPIPTADLVTSRVIATNKANAEFKTQPVATEAKISKWST